MKSVTIIGLILLGLVVSGGLAERSSAWAHPPWSASSSTSSVSAIAGARTSSIAAELTAEVEGPAITDTSSVAREGTRTSSTAAPPEAETPFVPYEWADALRPFHRWTTLDELDSGTSSTATTAGDLAATTATKTQTKGDRRRLSLRERLSPLWRSRRSGAATQRKPRTRRARDQRAWAGCDGVWNLPRLKTLPFEVGEELSYDLSTAGAFIGRFETKVGRPRTVQGRRVYPLFGRARTTGFARAFRPFIGRYMAMADMKDLAPIGVRVEAKYDKDQRWERVRFADEGRSLQADFTLRGREIHRDYTSNHRMTDLLSVLYLARHVDVTDGLTACQHVFGSRRLWRMSARVAGTDTLSTPAGRMEAWKVQLSFDRMPTPGLRNKNRPHYDMQVYLAKDDFRTPLAFVVDYKGLTARGDLRRWSLTGKSKDRAWRF